MNYSSTQKLLFQQSLPIIVSMAAIALCNITDRVYIGESAGEQAFAGLALTLPFVVLMCSIGSIIGIGGANQIAEALKKKDITEAQRVLGNSLLTTFLVSLLLMAVFGFFTNELLTVFGGRDDTIPFARRYLYFFMAGIFFINFMLNFTTCMRVTGYPGKATWILFGCIVLNVLLNTFFIFGLGLSIEGGALATGLSCCICSIPVLQHFLNRNNPLRFRLRCLKPNFRMIYKIIGNGMPPFFMNMTICTVSIIMNNYLVFYGGYMAISAYGIISSYSIIIMMILSGFSQGMQMMIRMGNEKNNIRQTLIITLRICTAVTSIGFIVGELFAEYMSMAFTANPVLDQLTRTGLRITFCTLPILGFQLVTANFFQSISKARQALFMNLSRQFIFLIPSISIFSVLWNVSGIWWTIPFSDFMATSIGIVFLWLEKRNKDRQMTSSSPIVAVSE